MISLSPRNWIPLIGLFVVGVFYYFLTWSSDLPLLGGDHPVYLLMADHLSFYGDLSPETTAVAMRYSPFPPFYPVVLGFFGGTGAHVSVAHAITTTFLMASLASYFIWIRSEAQSQVQAFSLSLIFSLLSTTLLQSFGILSENLYLFLTIVAIWLVNKPNLSMSRLYMAAIIIGLAAITRTIGISLVIAFAVYLFLYRKDQRVRLILVSIAPLLFWNILRLFLDHKGGYFRVIHDLITSKQLEDFLLEQVSIESHALWVGWITSLDHLPTLMTLIVGSIIGAVCLAGVMLRTYLKKIDGIYIIIYLSIVLLWPFSLESKRFIYAVMPILLFHGLEWISYLTRHFTFRKILISTYPLVIALVAFPATGSILNRVALSLHDENRMYASSVDWYSDADLNAARINIRSHQLLVQSWKKVSRIVPENECVYHVDAPSLMLYADRRSYSPPIASTREQFLRMANSCRYFYLGSYSRLPYRQIFYPKDYIVRDGRIVFVDRVDDMEGAPILGMLIEMPQ